MEKKTSERLFEEAKKHIPGGVNSPARAFKAVGGTPRFIKSGKDQYIYDEDGNKYIDYIGSWGPMILGNNQEVIMEQVREAMDYGLSFGAATKREVEMADLFCQLVPSVEMVRMVNSGTEATMSALRLARGYTGKDKIIKFEGCYHGHCDSLLVKAGSGLIAEGGKPDSGGVTEGCAKDTLTAKYNDLESVKALFSQNKGEIAALIIEPVAANMGVIPPKVGFLEGIRELCTKEGAVLIFDEVISGFRLALGGAQERYQVTPDLSTFGKIIGGGMPVGAYGGKKEIMKKVAPLGDVYQAGTLSGNPIAMAAGIAQLTYLRDHKEVYENINKKGKVLFEGIKNLIKKYQLPYTLNYVGSIGTLFFTSGKVENFSHGQTCDLKRYGDYFRHMMDSGIYIAPAQFEAMFISNKMEDGDIEKTLQAVEEFFKTIKRG